MCAQHRPVVHLCLNDGLLGGEYGIGMQFDTFPRELVQKYGVG